jgi:prevent-host-death family protein
MVSGTVSATEARQRFPELAREVHESRRTVTVFKNSKPYVAIVPVSKESDSHPNIEEIGQQFIDEYADVFQELAK